MAGIRGLQGVVRKTVNDELQANIWDPQHMDKIVPSLLFNLQQEGGIERSNTLAFTQTLSDFQKNRPMERVISLQRDAKK